MAAALTYRDFRVLWFGAFTSTIGTWMQKVAQSWLVLTHHRLRRRRSSSGLDSFLGELPILLLTLVGGVVADRHDRRQLLLTSQCMQMAPAFTLAALVYWDVVRIWHVLALSVVTGLAQAFGGPAYQSLLPSLVGKQRRAECDRVQLDPVQPGARDRSAPRRRGPRRLRHGGVLRPQRPVVSRGDRRDSARCTSGTHRRPRRAACITSSRAASTTCARIQRSSSLAVLGFAATFLGGPAAHVPAALRAERLSAAA